MVELDLLNNLRIQDLHPKIRKNLIEFCSSLDDEEHPECVLISSGKHKTLAGLAKIYKRLKSKKEKKARKHLKEAEKLILAMGSLHHTTIVRSTAPSRPLAAKVVDRGNLDMAERELDAKVADAIQKKILGQKPLTRREVVQFVRSQYSKFAAKVSDTDPLTQGKTNAEIVICSDSRLVLGDGTLTMNLSVKSIAGNPAQKTDSDVVVIVGHRGYTGCGVVQESKKLHQGKTTSDDPAITAICSMPSSVTSAEDPEVANIQYQVNQLKQQGKKAYGICVDIEAKSVELVAGPDDSLSRKLMSSLEAAVTPTGNMATHIAGVIIVTREGRRFSGKTIMDNVANTVFEVNFRINGQGKIELPPEAEGSAKFANSHVKGVNTSHLVVVVDPDPRVAQTVASLISSKIPGIIAIPMHEDQFSGTLKELKSSAHL
ncbi:MAG: hypothetical protein ABID61_02140 [Candidatus Micrarchaeota archaeon]